jgi:Rrf2 family protein
MLALTKKTEYALIALCHLARAQSDIVSARDISERHAVRLPLMMNVLKSLSQNGLLHSVRGANGGYRLAVPVDRVSLARVVEAIEGPVRLVRCVTHSDDGHSHCELVSTCPVRGPVVKIHHHLERFLESLTVADVAFDERYGVPAEFGVSAEPLRVLAR